MDFFKLKPGDNKIRILPPLGMEFAPFTYPFRFIPKAGSKQLRRKPSRCFFCEMLLRIEFETNEKNSVAAWNEGAD